MGKGSRVVVCGSASVGKTAILEQLLYGNHTVGVENSETLEDVYIASVETERGVKEQVVIIVLGNKADLTEQRQVDSDMAQQWARSERVKLWEVSVTERKTLIEPFTALSSKLNQPQGKSTFPLPGRKSKGTPSSDN
ncbi:NF-kappa-B inhibitor-interacting Ras-like protein 1 isoform X2 [Bombina bombina]|uniref:NF-kappa-B inhibitor-interacting Ras-like protein 1 isoform X2 n=1 Tax=Bombina bombina TaxID=8345 RepID=UPI00235B0E6F|nr:NF-kappa-B inhibitor-interacting Ras-like protein 1 isoform X2 [Bombina bombina]